MEANNIRKLPTHLQKLVNEAITLLRKAEKLALRYDHQNGFFLAFSGGKDSIVLHAIAELAGVKFKAHMSLTSIDPPSNPLCKTILSQLRTDEAKSQYL